MAKELDIRKSVYDICAEDIMAKSILLKLGLKAVSSPKAMGALRNRRMDQIVPIRGKGMRDVLKAFEDEGYTIIGLDDLD